MWFKDDFGAHYKWLPVDANQIHKAFESRGTKLVKWAMGRIKDGSDDGSWLLPDVLECLRQYCASDEKFLIKNEIGKQNRASDIGAPLYAGGSITIHEHFDRMSKDQQRKPTAIEIVHKTKKTKRGEWISPKVGTLLMNSIASKTMPVVRGRSCLLSLTMSFT